MTRQPVTIKYSVLPKTLKGIAYYMKARSLLLILIGSFDVYDFSCVVY